MKIQASTVAPIKVNWNLQKDKLLEKFPILTNKDLNFEAGKMDEMLGRLQIKLGKTRKELYKIFVDILSIKHQHTFPW